jgi:diguanylate cyclase (GGDEF)-like protein/PAS domain S-box-containing protein
MRGSASSIGSRRKVPWLRKHGDGVRLVTCFLSFALIAEFLRPVSDANLIWLAYGVLLSFVLLASRRSWPACMATGFAALIAGSWCMIRGLGPFVHLPAEPSVRLQVLIGSGVLLLCSIPAVLKRKQKSIQRLEQIAALHALISESSRDAIILTDLSGQRTYSSSAAERLGWKPEDLLTEGGLEMVHPEDQQRTQAIVCELKSGREEAMIECRIRKCTGEYVWVEASLRVAHDMETGLPSGFLSIVRDVSQRKLAEQRLQEAYNAVEALAVTDELTGLSNRRRFDQYLANEWRRSMRDHQPLSLLMLDVDKFKAYNDTYGHQRGDSCLRQVAEACLDVVSRPGDLVARFGGEEFVVVLPNTGDEGALNVAEDICAALRSRRLPHSGNTPGIVTISAGCATLVPRFGKHAAELIEMADQALYRAKHNGRNCVCNGNVIENSDEETPIFALPEVAVGKTA